MIVLIYSVSSDFSGADSVHRDSASSDFSTAAVLSAFAGAEYSRYWIS
ncbi:MAG: hypothetical protein IJH40_03975 [Ruminococcus sp.]|nr:hypothetical protein [Ruminococcus sp.]MBQ3284780.1 hypothetical protein [Ruminococcus sp.]